MSSVTQALATQLTEGNDPRLSLVDGRNAYGCTPMPEDDLLAFGSCTASAISRSAWECLQKRLEAQPAPPWTELRQDWLNVCALSANTPLYFAPSGTDLHARFFTAWQQQVAGQRTYESTNPPTCVITVAEGETGRGIPAILSQADRYLTIALRDKQGLPRPVATIDAEFAQAVSDANDAGMACLVIAVDVSKTGLIAPSNPCLNQLSKRPSTTILMDACQFRLSRQTLQAYLDQGLWVALTGSKFMGGPSFSGVLLHAKQSLSDWPSDDENQGARLRTAAAVHDMRRFFALPNASIADALTRFAQTVECAFAGCKNLVLLAAPPIPRATSQAWDSIPSIFLFWVKNAEGTALDVEALKHLRNGLIHDERVQLGQAVEISPDLAALRLCASARWVISAVTENRLDAMLNTLISVIQSLDAQIDTAITGSR
jgi:hypothetical protein